MGDIEKRIRELPWSNEVPDALRERIFGAATNPLHGRTQGDRRKIYFAWASACAAACLGFAAGVNLGTKGASDSMTRVETEIRVVEVSSSRNSFDFSTTETQVLPGDLFAFIDSGPETME